MMGSQKKKNKTMDIFLIQKTLNNEEGMVMIFTLMILMILTISGVAAINISNNEASIVRNEQFVASEFYNAETGINDARINFNNWLTNAFLNDAETIANSTPDSISTDAGGAPLATLQIRCIENNNAGGVTPIFGGVADEMPAMPHKAGPPAGSGYSVKHFEVRRYSITSTSNTGNTVLQTGVWKVFNKY
jgi:type IV pilus assembly PilX-like protein